MRGKTLSSLPEGEKSNAVEKRTKFRFDVSKQSLNGLTREPVVVIWILLVLLVKFQKLQREGKSLKIQ